MPYFTVPMRPQQQSHYYNALDPFLQAVMTQLYDEEEHADKQQQCGEGSSHPCAPPNSNASAKGTTESGKKKARAACAPRHTTTFKPNFDVYEGAEAYYVEGDLPGLSDKKVLNIEFSDDRTLVVSGRVDKAQPQPQPQPEAQPQQQQEEKDEEVQDDEQKSFKPTVEDTEDEDDFSVVSGSSSRDSHAEAEKKTAEKKTVVKESEEKPRKVWLAERTYGEFRRVFTFSTPVEVDGVTAKLADGLLAVEVPKKVNRGVKKIQVL